MWEQVTICQLYHVRTSYNLSAISCHMWEQVTICQLYHVRTIYNLSAISCENKLQFVSYIMWEQVTICQLYHVRTSYNLSAISCHMWEQVTICKLYHERTIYNLSAISCENKLQFVSYIMWEQTVPLLIFVTINRNKDSMWFINIWLQSSTTQTSSSHQNVTCSHMIQLTNCNLFSHDTAEKCNLFSHGYNWKIVTCSHMIYM
jgi:hypothetical protein